MTVAIYVSDTTNKNLTTISNATGDFGKNILSGKGKQVVIDLNNVTLPTKFKLLVVADDGKSAKLGRYFIRK